MLKRTIQGNAYIHPGRRQNWDKSERYTPGTVHTPRSVDEVVRLVKDCARRQRKLFPIGSLHSWSLQIPRGADFDFLDLREMNQVLTIDEEERVVEAQAGTKVREVNRQLLYLDEPMMLQGTGSTQEQSLAGALSNSTNPYSGGRWTSLSSYAEEIELVDGNGDLRILTDADGDMMKAARVSLGLLGVITRVKLRVHPAFLATRVFRQIDPSTCCQEIDAAIGATDLSAHSVVHTFENNEMRVSTVRPATEQEAVGVDGQSLKEFRAKQTRAHYTLLTPLINLSPRFARHWQRTAHGIGTKVYNDRNQINWSTHIFENDDSIFAMAEFYIPRRRFDEFYAELHRMYRTINDPYIHPWIQFRPQRAVENTLMSPAQGEAHVTALIGSTPLPNKYREGYAAWENFMVSGFEARTHWGCRHVQKSRQLFQSLYGELFDRFVAVRRQLDPNNMFLREPDKIAFR
ncbi:MAG: FAD-binding oxidoreductase [Planctomycetota bacterium]